MVRRLDDSSSSKVTRFSKPIIGKDHEKALLWPPFFARNMEHLANQETEIEDYNGHRWTVTCSYVNNCLAFEKGWRKFYIDHDVKEGELLVFQYIEESHFVAHIFGLSARERIIFDNVRGPREKRPRRAELEPELEPEPDVPIHSIDGNSDTSLSESHNHQSPVKRVSTCIDLDDDLSCMRNRDSELNRGEDRNFLYDLSNFEMDIENVSNKNKGPSHAQVIERAEKCDNVLNTRVTPSHATENTKKKKKAKTMGEAAVIHTSQRKLMSKDVSKFRNGTRSSNNFRASDSEYYCSKCIRMLRNRSVSTSVPKNPIDAGKKPTTARKCDEIVRPAVKVEPDMSRDSVGGSTALNPFSAVVKSLSYLELPVRIPSIPGKKDKRRGKVVYLRDPAGGLWATRNPRIFCGSALTANWVPFCKSNNIKPGDECKFQVENPSLGIYKVDVKHRSR